VATYRGRPGIPRCNNMIGAAVPSQKILAAEPARDEDIQSGIEKVLRLERLEPLLIDEEVVGSLCEDLTDYGSGGTRHDLGQTQRARARDCSRVGAGLCENQRADVFRRDLRAMPAVTQ